MITTVTLNVAIDKAYVVDDLQVGDVIRVKECSYTAGGKGLNVSKVATIAGGKVIATGFIGGHAGAFVEEELSLKEIETKFVKVQGETRSCINIIQSNTGVHTEFLEPGVEVTQQNVADLVDTLKELTQKSRVLTISGSVPRGVDHTIYQQLIKIGKENGNKVILDTSGKLLEQGILALPTMIKPNISEMSALIGRPMDSMEEVIAGAKQLHEKGIEIVAVSLGEEGVLVVCEAGIYQAKPPTIKAVNTVGCGDSMVAGFAMGLMLDYTIEETLKLAVAVSAANALTMETGFYYKEDAEKIYNQVTITKY